MASGLTRNQMPGNRLRVRIPCPPLCQIMLVSSRDKTPALNRVLAFHGVGTPCRPLTPEVHYIDIRPACSSCNGSVRRVLMAGINAATRQRLNVIPKPTINWVQGMIRGVIWPPRMLM
jgi:hypothetical protein